MSSNRFAAQLIESRLPTCDDYVLQSLSTQDLLRFAQCSKETKSQVESFIHRRFKLYEILKPFIPEQALSSFRCMLFKTQAVVSGSVALQFFTRVLYKQSDLDVYVECKFLADVEAWFRDVGYVVKPTSVPIEGLVFAPTSIAG